jgi:hypothetical protein
MAKPCDHGLVEPVAAVRIKEPVATIRGRLTMWEEESGYTSPAIKVDGQDLAAWLAAQCGVPLSVFHSQWSSGIVDCGEVVISLMRLDEAKPTEKSEAAPEPESQLPEWDDLRGRAPDATGGLSSEAFVRELRDGWR